MINNCYYVTTSIPYVNAAPHLGHALELVQADVLARHRRLRGRPVRFLSGTDEYAIKNVAAARTAGVATADFVAEHGDRFVDLTTSLDISNDDFIRTSSDPRHRPAVERVWKRCARRGDYYRHSYTGLYCLGCEQFYAEDELVDGRCREHGVAPEEVTESNWFFRLSRYGERILEAIESGRVQILPEQRRNEVLTFLRGGLNDISVSRPSARADGWGIAVPDDPDQVVYVWWDALTNYISSLGFGTGHDDYRRWWLESGDRVHVVGKGITRFHAVYWLALLLSIGEPLPTTILVHEYLTVDGAKLSKSSGTVVAPDDLLARFGPDAVRWWLVSDVARVGDTDFTDERLRRRYQQDLAGGIGNLIHRTVSLIHRYRSGHVPESDGNAIDNDLAATIDAALSDFDLRAATEAIRAVVTAANREIEAFRPWEVAKQTDETSRALLDGFLGRLVSTCRLVGGELGPFLPTGAERISAQLTVGADERLPPAQPVFGALPG